jgi:hypothetical protein
LSPLKLKHIKLVVNSFLASRAAKIQPCSRQPEDRAEWRVWLNTGWRIGFWPTLRLSMQLPARHERNLRFDGDKLAPHAYFVPPGGLEWAKQNGMDAAALFAATCVKYHLAAHPVSTSERRGLFREVALCFGFVIC